MQQKVTVKSSNNVSHLNNEVFENLVLARKHTTSASST
jgi:hypothetical protein